MTFKENRRKQYSKRKNRTQKCKKEEYFDKKEKVCKKKTKSKHSKKDKKSKKGKKVSLPSSTLQNMSNSLYGFNPNEVKSMPKKTRIFLIMGHSELCSFKELRKIKKGKEPLNFRINLKEEPLIKDINNLRVVNIQSIGLNLNTFSYILIKFLKENEKFHSAFIQMNSIEKADFLNKFMKYLYLQKTDFGRIYHSKSMQKKMVSLFEGNISSFKVYPKPENNDYPQNPLDASFRFYPNTDTEDAFMKYGLYELTVPNYENFENKITIFGEEYKINPIFDNIILQNLYDEQKKKSVKDEDTELTKVRRFLGIPDEWSMNRLTENFDEIELEQFNYYTKINKRLFLEIKKKYEKSNDIKEACIFKQKYLLKMAIEEANILDTDNVIFLDGGCKGISDLPYNTDKSAVIPSKGMWQSSIKFNPWTTYPLGYSSVHTEQKLPHKYRKILQNVDYNI